MITIPMLPPGWNAVQAADWLRWYNRAVWNLPEAFPAPSNAALEACHCGGTHYSQPCQGFVLTSHDRASLQAARAMRNGYMAQARVDKLDGLDVSALIKSARVWNRRVTELRAMEGC